ncbi:MAG: HAMP domain-containing histidine kinase, partial [Methylococcaceae bacterium]|nr:HAMP domain-containing histidine kinase [Methylococcaceae bacterium]
MRALLAWLASFRLRILFRSAFLALGLAVVALALAVLQEEKQRSHDHYAAGFAKTKEQIVARLRHPSGQLALLNPGWSAALATAGRPVVLPFSALDFDDQIKVKNAVEMAGCLVQYPGDASLCVAIGNNPWAGGFIYAAGSFVSGPLIGHRIGDEFLDGAHRLRVTVAVRGQTYRWLAPYETLSTGPEGMRGRFTGYAELDQRDYTGARPVKEFRGWVWQSAQCLDPAAAEPARCPKKSFFSLRLPVQVLGEELFHRGQPVWPPPDLDRFQVHVQILPPGQDPALFDSHQAGAAPPFTLADLTPLLLPGESLIIGKPGGQTVQEVARMAGKDFVPDRTSPLLNRLIRKLPVEPAATSELELTDTVATPLGSFRLQFKGDARSVNRNLSAAATRLSWLVGAMLGAIGLAWLVIEAGIVRRIARLTRRTRGLSRSMQGDGALEHYDLADLKGSDELGLLATALNDLLRRVKEDAGREKIRAEQEKDLWHAVGHEIMSPLQSLLALHGNPADPSHRYISRMQQAVRILYGSASPSEAFQSSAVQLQALDIAEFVRDVTANAGLPALVCNGADQPVAVRADPYLLEDVFSHILNNADRHRHPGSVIRLELEVGDINATV